MPKLLTETSRKRVEDHIANGMMLLIPFDKRSKPRLVPRLDLFRSAPPDIWVDRDVALAIAADVSQFRRLTAERNNCILGWREMGLPGDLGALYSFLQ